MDTLILLISWESGRYHGNNDNDIAKSITFFNTAPSDTPQRANT